MMSERQKSVNRIREKFIEIDEILYSSGLNTHERLNLLANLCRVLLDRITSFEVKYTARAMINYLLDIQKIEDTDSGWYLKREE